MELAHHGLWYELTVEEQAARAERTGADNLHRCPEPWALRRQFLNEETGEVIPARCNRWECPHCGLRKVDVWRQLVREANPVLFLTLTKAGKTVEQCARAFQTFIQALRRGSKGSGKDRRGARQAYPIEYFAVLEEHKDFERVGFHWHVLIVGVDHIPYKEVIQPLWMSATHYNEQTGEGAMIADIQRVRSAKAIGYVTKYLLKAVESADRGLRQVKRVRSVVIEDALGDAHFERQETVEEVVSKARRIRYSRHFFPERVVVLREQLFSGMERQSMEQCEAASQEALSQDCSENGKPLEVEEEKKRSSWRLIERDVEGLVDVEVYKQRRYAELLCGFVDMRKDNPEEYKRQKQAVLAQMSNEVRLMVGGVYDRLKRRALIEALEKDRPLSRRVISMWDYRRKCLPNVS